MSRPPWVDSMTNLLFPQTSHRLIVFILDPCSWDDSSSHRPPSKSRLLQLFLLQIQGSILRQFSLLLSTKNRLLEKGFVYAFSLLGVVGTCPRTSPFIQNPLLFSTKILLYSFVIPPPLNSSLLVCYFIGYGSKDETSPKKEINPRAWGNCPKEKACSVFHCSQSSFSTCSRSLSTLHKPQCKSSFW